MIRAVMLSASALLASAAPAVAVQSAAPAPLKIVSCVVAGDTPNTALRPGVTYTNGVTVMVTNTSSKPISDMTLSGTYSGTSLTDTFKEALPPGSSIVLHKSHSRLLYSGPTPESCFVKHVDFADGTAWSMTPHTM